MVPTLSLLASAFASPGAAGAVHLGALPLPAGTQFAGGGGGIAWVGPFVAAAPVVEVGTALSDRFALTATGAIALPSAPATPLLVQSRFLTTDDGDFRFAITLAAAVIPYFDEEEPALETHLTPGIALDSGGEKVRFDLSVPIWGLSSYNQYFGIERFPVPVLSTFGANFLIGENQRVRLGLPEVFSWHYRGERVYVDIGGVTVLLVGAVWFKVGAVF